LILRKILKIVIATRCHILRLNAPNSISARRAYSAPPDTSRGRKEGEEGGKRGAEERGKERSVEESWYPHFLHESYAPVVTLLC